MSGGASVELQHGMSGEALPSFAPRCAPQVPLQLPIEVGGARRSAQQFAGQPQTARVIELILFQWSHIRADSRRPEKVRGTRKKLLLRCGAGYLVTVIADSQNDYKTLTKWAKTIQPAQGADKKGVKPRTEPDDSPSESQ